MILEYSQYCKKEIQKGKMINKHDIKYMKNQWGFYQVSPMPSENELEEYYSKKYYQNPTSFTYSTGYDHDNLLWKRNCAERIALMIEKLRGGKGGYFIDIGCGEGIMLDVMHDHKYDVKGIDFSSFGISRLNPHLLPYFSEGDIHPKIKNLYDKKMLFDIVFTGNVIEHVISPKDLIVDMKSILKPSGILIIVAPNDYSELQYHLLDQGCAEYPYWLSYPDHLSYFNYDSMANFLKDFDISVKACLGDFPIELNLFSDLTNYVKNRSAGPDVHKGRVFIENYLFSKDHLKALDLSILLGDLKVGRNLIYFCEKIG
jgi:2-polyprenyl-3-methyl-5-hydroxy-6-metoxy-1,4-benzoquinol methylase